MLQVENDSGVTPPPEIVSMVDKVAKFVASKNPQLEKYIAMNDGMRKYTFLKAADPYHAYYQHRLSEFRALNGSPVDEHIRPSPDDKNAALIESILNSYESINQRLAVGETVFVSPITGELVTYNIMSKDMKDPKYKEKKERLFAKIREATPTAQDDVISRSILEVARGCPDCFGTTEEEAFNAVKAQIERPYAVLFVNSKRPRLDDSLLVSEDEFLSQHQGDDIISVWVPDKGKMLNIYVESLSESVSSLKESIAEEIEDAPPAKKLKLKHSGDVVFFQDSPSLAYYNVAERVLLSLSW